MSGTQILQPSVSIAITNADQAAQNTPQKVLLVGQKLAGGSSPAGTIVENIASTDAPENGFFGEASMLAEMVRAYKRQNQNSRVDALPLDDAVGTSRLLDFTLGGTATANGDVTVVLGSDVLYTFVVPVTSGQAAAAVAANVDAAINASTKAPFTSGVVTATITLTARHDGLVYNDLGVSVVTNTAGITIATPLAEDTPGATDPTLTGILTGVIERYQGIVWPYADTTELEAFLAARFDANDKVLDGIGFVTRQNASLAGAQGVLATYNDHNIVIFYDKSHSELTGDQEHYIGPAQNEMSFVKSTYFAAIRALRLTDEAVIGRFLTSTASLDQRGGSALASLPYFNTVIDDLPLIDSNRGWDNTEIEALLAAGASVMGVNFAGTAGLVGEVVTTYLTDGAGNPDVTFTFLNYVDTASNIREYFFNNYKQRFAQSRLTEGSVIRGRDMANSVVIRAFTEQLYQDLGGVDFVLVQAGVDAVVFFKTNLTIVIDLATGKVTLQMQVPIVTQLRQIVATMQIVFSTTG